MAREGWRINSLEQLERVDVLQGVMEKLPQVDLPLVHRFTPGLYSREIFMPKGTLVISKIHKTEHQFIVSRGAVTVWDEKDGITHIQAPFAGVTTPGTRRVLYINEDCVWTTFHPTTETNVEQLEAMLVDTRKIDLPMDSAMVKAITEGISV